MRLDVLDEVDLAHLLHDHGRKKRVIGGVSHDGAGLKPCLHLEKRKRGCGVGQAVGKRGGIAHHGNV